MTTQQDERAELPPLPDPVDAVLVGWRNQTEMLTPRDDYYTADQMREYARSALLQNERAVIDRSDAVNLARNMLDIHDCKGITEKGVRVLCEAIMRMDAAITQATEAVGRKEGGV